VEIRKGKLEIGKQESTERGYVGSPGKLGRSGAAPLHELAEDL
jgi:hypothetical protein